MTVSPSTFEQIKRSVSFQIDRRQHRRFDPTSLKVFHLGERVPVVDFSRHGVSFVSQTPLEKHATLYLDLIMDEIKIESIACIVRNRRRTGMLYRFGVEFDPDQTLLESRVKIEAMEQKCKLGLNSR